MQNHSGDNLYIISAIGKDLVGLVSIITSVIYEQNCNIVDIRQSVAHGFFSAFIIIDISDAKIGIRELTDNIHAVSNQTGLKIIFEKFQAGRRKSEKKIISIILTGKDRPGIVAKTAITLSDYSINIESMKMLARGGFIIMNVLADAGDMTEDIEAVRHSLKDSLGRIDIGVSFQTENIHIKEKKIIVFNLTDDCIKNKIMEALDADESLADKIKNLSFEECIKPAAMNFKGIDVCRLFEFLSMIRITPDAFEIIDELKGFGFKIALVTNGFKYLPDRLKDVLKLDFAFGNSLEVKNGLFSGNPEEPVFNDSRKNDIMNIIAMSENVSRNDIVVIDDANLRLLGILIDPDDFIRELSAAYAGKKITEAEMLSIAALTAFK